MRGRWSVRRGIVVAMVVLGACAVPAATGFAGVGALVGLAQEGAPGNTVVESTVHRSTVSRVDLEDAPAPECDFPGSPPVLVDETSVPGETLIEAELTVGPSTIFIGPDRSIEYHVVAGEINTNLVTIYQQLVTQYFQATAAGEACAVLSAAVRFTG